ncbi:MAG: hypothetical protein ACM31L_11955 [Actinomycetota bacterium]
MAISSQLYLEFMKCFWRDAVSASNLQSIFQLGAALGLTFAVAGPEISRMLLWHVKTIEATKEVLRVLEDSLGQNLAYRRVLVVTIEEYLKQKAIRLSSDWDVQLFAAFAVANIVALVATAFGPDKWSIFTALTVMFFFNGPIARKAFGVLMEAVFKSREVAPALSVASRYSPLVDDLLVVVRLSDAFYFKAKDIERRIVELQAAY